MSKSGFITRYLCKIHNKEATTLGQVLTTLRQVYPGDDAFKADFAAKVINTTQSRNAKIVRYILSKLEKQAGGIDFDPESPNYTIEHVLPPFARFGKRVLRGILTTRY